MMYFRQKTAETEEMLGVFAWNHSKYLAKILIECSIYLFYIHGPLEPLLHESMQND